jgi:hypothetical protein
MPNLSKQWEVRFLIGLSRDSDDDDLDSVYIAHLYGETVEALRQEVCAYLKEHEPNYFETFGDHISGLKCYMLSDGEIDPPGDWPMDPEAFRQSEGWWVFSKKLTSGQETKDDERLFPSFLGDLECAVENFIETAFIPQKGPDYQSLGMVDNQLQLPLLEAVVREAEDYLLNDLLRRGWQVLALEYKGEVSRIGELTNRKAIFVLGHADFPAALATLDARDFYYHHSYSYCQGEQ